MIVIILNKVERENTVHDALRKRKVEGENWTSYKHLVDDEEKCNVYCNLVNDTK